MDADQMTAQEHVAIVKKIHELSQTLTDCLARLDATSCPPPDPPAWVDRWLRADERTPMNGHGLR